MWAWLCVWLGLGAAPAVGATPEDLPEAAALDERTVERYAAGDYTGADAAAHQALALRRATLGDTHPAVAENLNNLAVLRQVLGDLASSRAWLEEALAILRELHDGPHEHVANTLNNLGAVHHSLGEWRAAADRYREALDIFRALLGDAHPKVAVNLNNLAELARRQGDLAAARPLYEESLAIRRAALGDDHPDVASSLNNLALLRYGEGDYTGARPLFEQALATRRAALGENHRLVGDSLSNLGALLLALGDHVGARLFHEQGLAVRTAALGPDHIAVANSLNHLANLHAVQGDHQTAQQLRERALAIRQVTLGPAHPEVAGALSNLATSVSALGNPAEARRLLEEALAIQEASFGTTHPSVATTLNNLGGVLVELGELDAARTVYERSRDIREDLLGRDHPELANSLNNLASVMTLQGDAAAALPMYENGLEILRTTLGADHPHLAQGLTNLARLFEGEGQPEAALRSWSEALTIVEGGLRLLDGLSERQALAYLPTVRPALDGWLRTAEGDPATAWAHVLRFKGTVAARARTARALAAVDPALAPVAQRLAAIRREQARLAWTEVPRSDRADRLAELTVEQEALERELLTASARYRDGARVNDPSPAALCAELPPDSVLVDLLRYQTRDGPHYLAFVAESGTCAIHRIALGPAQAIDDGVAAWLEVLQDPAAHPNRVRQRGEQLVTHLGEPLLTVLSGASHWFVVPDGSLANIPFGALPLPGDRFVLEAHAVSYLDRANDLLRSAHGTAEGALVVGAVDYDVAREAFGATRSVLAPCNGGAFAALDGTETEADQLADRWRRARRRHPLTSLRGAQATELAVGRALAGKEVAHIASHGFFASEACRSALDEGGSGHDPMLLSGLVLAGANQPPDPLAREDGILTAAEVAALDLSSTRLVVLSACDTGVGEVRSGQGVLGLRRAFAVSGAQTLVMSLWAVPDAATAALMDRMYRLHLGRRGVAAAEALRQAQLEMLAAQRQVGAPQPHAWAAFIASGDWRTRRGRGRQ